jgi:hypothetical protein
LTRRARNRDVLDRKVVSGSLRRGLARDETAPGLVALMNNLGRVLLVLRLTRERELVLWLAIRNLVDAVNLLGKILSNTNMRVKRKVTRTGTIRL